MQGGVKGQCSQAVTQKRNQTTKIQQLNDGEVAAYTQTDKPIHWDSINPISVSSVQCADGVRTAPRRVSSCHTPAPSQLVCQTKSMRTGSKVLALSLTANTNEGLDYAEEKKFFRKIIMRGKNRGKAQTESKKVRKERNDSKNRSCRKKGCFGDVNKNTCCLTGWTWWPLPRGTWANNREMHTRGTQTTLC